VADVVNEFFRKHYPADWKMAWEMRMVGREYNGDRQANSTIFPEMICADGLRLSVQGHYGAYSYPRDDFAEEYRAVEIMGPKHADDLLSKYERDCNSVGDEMMIYPYVPVEVVCAVLEKHGGLSPTT
jgi:hypothetical protein